MTYRVQSKIKECRRLGSLYVCVGVGVFVCMHVQECMCVYVYMCGPTIWADGWWSELTSDGCFEHSERNSSRVCGTRSFPKSGRGKRNQQSGSHFPTLFLSFAFSLFPFFSLSLPTPFHLHTCGWLAQRHVATLHHSKRDRRPLVQASHTHTHTHTLTDTKQTSHSHAQASR